MAAIVLTGVCFRMLTVQLAINIAIEQLSRRKGRVLAVYASTVANTMCRVVLALAGEHSMAVGSGRGCSVTWHVSPSRQAFCSAAPLLPSTSEPFAAAASSVSIDMIVADATYPRSPVRYEPAGGCTSLDVVAGLGGAGALHAPMVCSHYSVCSHPRALRAVRRLVPNPALPPGAAAATAAVAAQAAANAAVALVIVPAAMSNLDVVTVEPLAEPSAKA